MKQPNENWLKYLLISSGPTYDDIVDLAVLYGFSAPTRDYLQELNNKISETKPKPFRKNSTKVRNWLRRQRVMSLINGDRDAVSARKFLGDTKMRPVLEALILADADRASIPKYCETIAGKKPTEKSVRLFEHYFWNRDSLSFFEWEVYLTSHPNGKMLVACHERGYEFALWKLGFRENIPQDQIVRNVLHEATMRYFETGGRDNTRDTAMTAKMWSETIFKSLEEMNKTGDGVQRVLDDLRHLALKLEETGIKDIDFITGGNHSVPDSGKVDNDE